MWGQEDLVIITLSRGKQIFDSPKLSRKKGQALGRDGEEQGCVGTWTLEQNPRENQGPR